MPLERFFRQPRFFLLVTQDVVLLHGGVHKGVEVEAGKIRYEVGQRIRLDEMNDTVIDTG